MPIMRDDLRDDAVEPLDRMLARNRVPVASVAPQPMSPLSFLPMRLRDMFRSGGRLEPTQPAPYEPPQPSMMAPWLRGEGDPPGLLGLGAQAVRFGNRMMDRLGRGAQNVASIQYPGVVSPPAEEPEPQASSGPPPTAPGLMMGGQPTMGSPGFDESRLRSDIGAPALPAASSTDAPVPMREGYKPPAPTAPPQMRAIRMPGGKLFFTNRDEYGGEEISTEQAGRELRAGDRSSMAMNVRPSSATMRSLVQASARAALQRGEGQFASSGIENQPPGHVTAGREPDMRPGVSFVEGTPEQRTRLDMETALGAAALGQANQQAEIASMPAAEAAQLDNKDIQTGNWLVRTFTPRLNATRKAAEAAATAIQDPNNPEFIPDPRARATRLREIETSLEQSTKDITDTMAIAKGQRPAQF